MLRAASAAAASSISSFVRQAYFLSSPSRGVSILEAVISGKPSSLPHVPGAVLQSHPAALFARLLGVVKWLKIYAGKTDCVFEGRHNGALPSVEFGLASIWISRIDDECPIKVEFYGKSKH